MRSKTALEWVELVTYLVLTPLYIADKEATNAFSEEKHSFPGILERVEFENIWNWHCDKYRYAWEELKKKYLLGSTVEGMVMYFYPQGVIFDMEDGAQGVADYAECKKNSLKENMYPGHKITGTVIGYDEGNMWIVITSDQIKAASR
ncbi:MAG: hypothetical protein FWG40_09680 [Peptococcaceae bacterium]|nr:hypothetical protein [Peptococcaceae bacterium]